MILTFDTETTGMWSNKPLDDPSQPYLVQLGALLKDEDKNIRGAINLLVKPEGWEIPEGAAKIHGITTEIATTFGLPLKLVMYAFEGLVRNAEEVVAHNFSFDDKIIQIAHARLGMKSVFTQKSSFCTMKNTTELCKIPHPKRRSGYKWPTLEELYKFCFGTGFEGAHDAFIDLKATSEAYEYLKEKSLI